jgi:replicative DNA helicase
MTVSRLLQADDYATDRQLPQSPDAERAILGSVLINNHAYYRLGSLTADDFFRDSHRTIFKAIARMAEDGSDVEPLTLKEELAKRSELEQIGGVAYVTSLMDVVPDVANVERYVEIVQRLSKKRAQIVAGNALMRDGFDPASEPEDAAASAMAALSPLVTTESTQARPLVEVLSEAAAAMLALKERNQSVALTSGWSFLDEHQVFSPVFSLAGGETKLGKTALMLNFAEALASHDQPCAIFSLESSVRALALRYFSIRTSITHRKMRDWRWFSDKNHAAVADVQRDAAKRGIFIGFGPFTAEEILLEARRLRAIHGIRACFVDYVQNVELKGKHIENREERFHKISKMFQLAAPDMDMHIMCMSQLRDGAGAEGRILMGDIAYAKSIGKSARVVLFFKRDGCRVTGQIEANNEGRTNDFCAHFQEETQQFEEGARDGREFWPCVDTAEGTVHRRPATEAATLNLF